MLIDVGLDLYWEESPLELEHYAFPEDPLTQAAEQEQWTRKWPFLHRCSVSEHNYDSALNNAMQPVASRLLAIQAHTLLQWM